MRNVGTLKERFIIILGYNSITSEIIKQANEYGLRSVVIEKDETKRDALLLENFTPTVFCLSGMLMIPKRWRWQVSNQPISQSHH